MLRRNKGKNRTAIMVKEFFFPLNWKLRVSLSWFKGKYIERMKKSDKYTIQETRKKIQMNYKTNS